MFMNSRIFSIIRQITNDVNALFLEQNRRWAHPIGQRLNMNRHLTLLLAGLTLTAALTINAASTLQVGSPAPALKANTWVKGDAVAKFEAGKVYVVEFWATWCPPCRKSIPHLTKLAGEFQGKVSFIGVSVWEREKDEKAREQKVATFVKGMGDQMNYTVATDTAEQFMAKNWMQAAGQNGIPTAFVVGKDGKIAWIGHPMDGLDQALKKATAAQN
jgi:thiol-disulfide isomerase/thioredoxin